MTTYVTWSSTDGTQLNIFHVQEVLEEMGADMSTTMVKENPRVTGGFIITTNNEELGKRLMGTLELKGQPITASDTTSANAKKCVIKCPSVSGFEVSEILARTRDQGVIDIVKKKGKNGTLVLSLREDIPPVIRLGALRIPTAIFVPRPMLCRNCFCFGHAERLCRNKPACPRCGKEHGLDGGKKCSKRQSCRSCQGGHEPIWGGCPAWKQEVAIKRIMRVDDISGAEARARYKASCKGKYFELVRGTKLERCGASAAPIVDLDDEDSDSSGAMEMTKHQITTKVAEKSPKKGGGAKRKPTTNNEEEFAPTKKGKGGKRASSLTMAKPAKQKVANTTSP